LDHWTFLSESVDETWRELNERQYPYCADVYYVQRELAQDAARAFGNTFLCLEADREETYVAQSVV
jgi:hypothetical protein